MSWLQDFKIAIISQDFSKMDELFDSYPNFDSLEDMRQAAVLIAEALRLMKVERTNVVGNMKRLEIGKSYLTRSFA